MVDLLVIMVRHGVSRCLWTVSNLDGEDEVLDGNWNVEHDVAAPAAKLRPVEGGEYAPLPPPKPYEQTHR